MNKTLLYITIISFSTASFIQIKDINNLNKINKDYYKADAKISSINKSINGNSAKLTLLYKGLNGDSLTNEYNRTIIRNDEYSTHEIVKVYVNKFDNQDVIIEGELEYNIKITWVVIVLSLVLLLGNVFWKNLKDFIV